MEVTVHVTGPVTINTTDPAVASALASVLTKLEEMRTSFMATLDDTLALVTAEDTKIDSLLALLDGIKQQLADALAGTTLPPDVQAKVDAVFDQMTTDVAKVDAAIAANTPTP